MSRSVQREKTRNSALTILGEADDANYPKGSIPDQLRRLLRQVVGDGRELENLLEDARRCMSLGRG